MSVNQIKKTVVISLVLGLTLFFGNFRDIRSKAFAESDQITANVETTTEYINTASLVAKEAFDENASKNLKIAEENKLAEEARLAVEARMAEKLRIAVEIRIAETAKNAEAARLAEEAKTGEALVQKTEVKIEPVATAAVKTPEIVPAKVELIETQIDKTYWLSTVLNLRSTPSKDGSTIGSYPLGTEVHGIATVSNGWIKVQIGNATGYMSGNYLSTTKVEKAVAPQPTVATAPTYSPYKMYVIGKTLTYKNGGIDNGQAIIDGNINLVSTWGGAETWSGTDGMNTHFIGHSHGAFKGLGNISIGAQIIVTDGNGNPTFYKVTNKIVVDDDCVGVNDGVYYYDYVTGTGGGEVITLQTCQTSTTNWMIRAVKVN